MANNRVQPLPIEERFWPKVHITIGGCWLWTGSRIGQYGDLYSYGRPRRAHRLAYELMVGPIPEGLMLDHLCRVKLCVNPAHLEAVTSRENTLRGETIAARNAAKTHCKQGHEFTPENTHWSPRGRACRACSRIGGMKRYWQKKGPRKRTWPEEHIARLTAIHHARVARLRAEGVLQTYGPRVA